MLEYRPLAAGTIPADCGYEARQSPARLWALRDQRSEGVREKVMGKLKMGVMQMVEAARAEIEEVEASDAVKEAGDPDCLVIDIRDVRERKRDGYIPDSFHCPRGMIEFWVDPDSPYFKEVFQREEALPVPLRRRLALRPDSSDRYAHGHGKHRSYQGGSKGLA